MKTRIILRVAAVATVIMLWLITPASAAETRDAVLESATAHWRLGDGAQGAKHPLTQVGDIRLNVAAEGEGATVDAKVARLAGAYFDAGQALNLEGDQCTVYLRARDPQGRWGQALFAKRGTHATINFNLFSSGDRFGFELHGAAGLGSVTFPLSQIKATAWHDLIGRYDGKTIEIICDGKVMASEPWEGGALTQNQVALLIGAEINEGQAVRPFSGDIEEAALWSRALSDDEIAALVRKAKLMKSATAPEIRISPFHIRPKTGNAGDAIAFYWQGQYHLFYLHQQKWAHIVSTDLIQWKELPPALSPCDDPNGPDASCWTGSVVEHGGTFYLFYTGQNPKDPKSDQKVMLATSKDLITWEKQPDRTFYPDGKIYWSKSINGPIPGMGYHHQAFRDPDVFWHEGEKKWWMIFHALTAEGHKPCIALYTSHDLLNWTPRPPLATYPQSVSLDCPHVAPVQGRWFIIAADTSYTSADKPEGPYPPDMKLYDSGDLFVPKSLFDGKRRLIWGWIRDVEGSCDSGKPQWGGTLSLPREIFPGPTGQLYSRPAAEITAAFTETALNLASKPMPDITSGTWNYANGKLVSGPDGGACRFNVPDDYMMQATFKLDPGATLTIKMRQQKDDNVGYPLVISPKHQEVSISRAQNRFGRNIELDAAQPITVQAFVQGAILECFINGKEAFTCRAYDYSTGGLSIEAAGGAMKILDLTVKTLPQKGVQVAVYYFPNWGPVTQSEWGAIKAAKPRFEGHAQPKIPVWIHHYPLPDFPATDFGKAVNDYFRAVEKGGGYNGLEQPAASLPAPYHLNVSMGWDSSPRCPANADWMTKRGYPFGAVMVNNTPERFRDALLRAKEITLRRPPNERIVTINSWNEWGEGSYLEPDTVHNMKYLEAVREVFGTSEARKEPDSKP
jgi:sucrose-6-phosphate hydrolase SacC (GH32 family)